MALARGHAAAARGPAPAHAERERLLGAAHALDARPAVGDPLAFGRRAVAAHAALRLPALPALRARPPRARRVHRRHLAAIPRGEPAAASVAPQVPCRAPRRGSGTAA